MGRVPHLQSPCCVMTAMGLSLQECLPAREPLPLSWEGGGLAREGLGLAA